MMSAFVIFLILLALFVVVAIIVAFTLAITGTVRARRDTWVAVRPRGERPVPEQLPPGLRTVLAAVSPQLAHAGFVEVESFYADRFAANTSWSQVLFVNRGTGERASVMGFWEAGTEYLDFMFGTEFPTGHLVSTGVAGHAWMSLVEPLDCDVPALLARHRSAVAKAVADSGREFSVSGMRPAVGDEFAWLEERAARVARDVAKQLGLRVTRKGDEYRVTWFASFIGAANRQIGGGNRRIRRGFDVLLPDGPGS